MESTRTDKNSPISFKKMGMMLIAVIVLSIVLFTVFILTPILLDFRPLVVKLNNHSGKELVSVELLLDGADDRQVRYVHDGQIPSGGGSTIRPELDMQGESSLTLEAIDAEGRTYSGILCGYMETLSGDLTVTIGEDGQVATAGVCM